jgi:acyl carrier protein
MDVIGELKKIMLEIGIEERIVNDIKPDERIAGSAMDSADYPAFLVAVEERYGITITDRYSLKLRTLNDFKNFIDPGQ